MVAASIRFGGQVGQGSIGDGRNQPLISPTRTEPSALLKIESTLQPQHRIRGQRSEAAHQSYMWNRAEPLHIRDRFPIEERQLWERDLVSAASPLGRERHIKSTSARGGAASRRDTITTGRVLAASPRSASHTSPGAGLI